MAELRPEPAPGTRLVIELTDAGRVAMAPQVGPDVGRVEGALLQRSDSQFVTGRDLVIGTAIVLLGGSAMLVAGLQLQISWLATAGGVSLGILIVLVLLVIFLSS